MQDSIANSFPDLTPIEQDDGPAPIVKINYTQTFTLVMNIFRAILVKEEYSQRALLLSAEVIHYNAANYTAWQYRRKCVSVLVKDLSSAEQLSKWKAELDYCTEQCECNTKNYQVWFHRRACIAALNDAAGELHFIASILDDDAKNYHAWGHRQWVLRTFALWSNELDYVDKLLEQDVRNNSAWNQRYYVLKSTRDLTDTSIIASEISCAPRRIVGSSPLLSPRFVPTHSAKCHIVPADRGCETRALRRRAQSDPKGAPEPIAMGLPEGPRGTNRLQRLSTAA